MNREIKNSILYDRQVIKFSAYGFLKNLQFFEPYLLLFLMANGISLFQIGILIAIREIVINIFEIPSGLIADYIGCKIELCLCFVFYIVSFIFFFFSTSFLLAAVAMVFFGFGEAFRSGTHKAMIYTYLEKKDWSMYKTFVYGKTRSSSLAGSAISSLLAILIVLNMPSSRDVFLVSTIPYVLDFFLIMSYPNYLNKAEMKEELTLKELVKAIGKNLRDNKKLRRIIVGEGLFEAIIKTIKDFIQPMMELIIVGTGAVLIVSATPEDNLKIVLGVLYFVLNLVSAVGSRSAYRFKKKKTGNQLLNFFYILLGIVLLFLAIGSKQYLIVSIGFLLLYVVQNIRKPIYMDEIDCNMNKHERATVLSVATQFRSIVLIALAPLIGWIADTWGIATVMYTLAFLVFISFPFIYMNSIKKI